MSTANHRDFGEFSLKNDNVWNVGAAGLCDKVPDVSSFTVALLVVLKRFQLSARHMLQ